MGWRRWRVGGRCLDYLSFFLRQKYSMSEPIPNQIIFLVFFEKDKRLQDSRLVMNEKA